MNPRTETVAASTRGAPGPAAPKTNGAANSKPASPAEELATLYPAPRSATIAGQVVEFKPCGLAQAGRIIDAGMPLYQLHLSRGDSLLALVEDEPAKIDALIRAATDFEPAWIAGLDALDKVDIIAEWLEVNGAFFVRRLFPKVVRLLTAAATLGDGRTYSTT